MLTLHVNGPLQICENATVTLRVGVPGTINGQPNKISTKRVVSYGHNMVQCNALVIVPLTHVK